MNTIDSSAAASFQLPVTLPPRDLMAQANDQVGSLQGTKSEEELREKFTQFVGETFFGQMLKAMRSTVGKPAYFHGGRAEEVFQGQLDQTLSQHFTEVTADRFAEPMFNRQFPHLARLAEPNDLNQLAQLRRQS